MSAEKWSPEEIKQVLRDLARDLSLGIEELKELSINKRLLEYARLKAVAELYGIENSTLVKLALYKLLMVGRAEALQSMSEMTQLSVATTPIEKKHLKDLDKIRRKIEDLTQ